MASPIKTLTKRNKKTGKIIRLFKNGRLKRGKRLKSNDSPRRNRRRLA